MRNRVALTGMGVLLVVALVGCGGGGGGAPTNGGGGDGEAPANHDPEIQSLGAGAEKLWPGDGTTVTCTASDADGDTLTYTWSADEGAFTDEGATVAWSGTGVSGTFEIRCDLTDGRGGSATGVVSVTVGMATVEGTVVNISSGAGVQSAQVTIDGLTGATDAEGRFLVSGVGPGAHEVSVQLPGFYISVDGTVTTEVTEPASHVILPDAIGMLVIMTVPPDPPPPPADLGLEAALDSGARRLRGA